MQLDTDEFSALADMLSAQRITAMKELEEARQETAYWRQRCERAEAMKAVADIENLCLKNCIMLSIEKIKTFMVGLDSVDRWALLRSFVQMSLPEELKAMELPLIDKVMPMPSVAQNGVVMNAPTFNGPMYDVHDNDEVRLNE